MSFADKALWTIERNSSPRFSRDSTLCSSTVATSPRFSKRTAASGMRQCLLLRRTAADAPSIERHNPALILALENVA